LVNIPADQIEKQIQEGKLLSNKQTDDEDILQILNHLYKDCYNIVTPKDTCIEVTQITDNFERHICDGCGKEFKIRKNKIPYYPYCGKRLIQL